MSATSRRTGARPPKADTPADRAKDAALAREAQVLMDVTYTLLDGLLMPARALWRRMARRERFLAVDGLDIAQNEPFWVVAGVLSGLPDDMDETLDRLREGADLAGQTARALARPAHGARSRVRSKRDPDAVLLEQARRDLVVWARMLAGVRWGLQAWRYKLGKTRAFAEGQALVEQQRNAEADRVAIYVAYEQIHLAFEQIETALATVHRAEQVASGLTERREGALVCAPTSCG